jgi:hypothetical protein
MINYKVHYLDSIGKLYFLSETRSKAFMPILVRDFPEIKPGELIIITSLDPFHKNHKRMPFKRMIDNDEFF